MNRTVSSNGYGPVRIGMSVEEARPYLASPLPAQAGDQCDHARIHSAQGNLLAMIVGGRVVRVEVRDTVTATERGALVGDTEDRVKALYSGNWAESPHKYTTGHYLTIALHDEPGHRLIFETDGERVVEYRVGRLPEVAWVEGCS